MPFKFNPFTDKLDIVEIDSIPPGGFVVGPASSNVGDIAVFANTTGNQISDSGYRIVDFLMVDNNLSDVQDAATSRSNLGLGSIAVLDDPLTETHGGTAQTSYLTGDILYASATDTLSKLPASIDGKILTLVSGVPSWEDAPASGVTSVSGTANRITSTGGTTPVIDIAATYVGQTSITTLGTISTGTWQGTVISPTYGGTGVNNGSSILTLAGNLSTSGAFASTFTMTGATSVTFPTSGTLATTSQIPSTPISLANGGTNANLTANNGGIFYSTSTAGAILAGTATANQVLLSGATAAPTWSTATYLATVAQGDIIYASASNVISSLAKDTNSTRYLSNTGTSNNPAWAQVNVTNGVTGTLPVGNGGTGVANPTAHDLLIGNGSSAMTQLAPSATSGVPLISQGSSSDPAYGTAVVAGGGTGVSTFSNTSALLTTGTSSTGALQNIASVATGQVLVSAGTSTIPAWSAAPSVTSITLSGGTALSAYAEGTFSPTITNSGTAPTVTYAANGQVGFYQKIGNAVIFTARNILSAYTAGTGNTQQSALPFTSANVTNRFSECTTRIQNVTFGASVLWYCAAVGVNTTDMVFQGCRSANTQLALVAGGPLSNTDIVTTGWYSTA